MKVMGRLSGGQEQRRVESPEAGDSRGIEWIKVQRQAHSSKASI
jgi:hypothetical protein